MRSTISRFTMRVLLFTGFLSITAVSTFSVAKDINTESETCSYNETEMLELSPREFDQNFEKGWPALVENGHCLEVAADLIHTYYTKNQISAGALKTLVWHEGQLRCRSWSVSKSYSFNGTNQKTATTRYSRLELLR